MNRSNDELVINQGPLIATGRKLDIFMKGGTVMGVQSPNGQVAFTRRGDLTIDQSGFLSTANGHVVLGDGGAPITVPVGVELSITDDGTVTATDPVQPDAPPTVVGNLLLRDASACGWCADSTGFTRRLQPKGRAVILRVGLIHPAVRPDRIGRLFHQRGRAACWFYGYVSIVRDQDQNDQ